MTTAHHHEVQTSHDGGTGRSEQAPEPGRFLHTGQAIVDIVMQVAAMPPVGGDVYASSSEFTAGGGFNVMAAAARDGGDVVYLGAYGDGPFGTIVRDALTTEGVETPAPPVRGEDSGYCVAIIDESAERTFVSYLGAEGQVTVGHLQAVDVRPADIVYVTGYSLLHEVNRESLLAWIPTLPTGARVIFDPSPLIDEIPDDAFDLMVRSAWLWSLNAREADLMLTRTRVRAESGRYATDDLPGPLARAVLDRDAEVSDAGGGVSDAARALVGQVEGHVLVRNGSDGAHLATQPAVVAEYEMSGDRPDLAIHHIAGMPVAPVDTNGAGDAHTGVLAAHLARGGELTEAIRRANIAAAVAVTRPGPATSPTAMEIDALMEGLAR